MLDTIALLDQLSHLHALHLLLLPRKAANSALNALLATIVLTLLNIH